jgi:hypothetical protein
VLLSAEDVSIVLLKNYEFRGNAFNEGSTSLKNVYEMQPYSSNFLLDVDKILQEPCSRVKWVPVTTAWRVIRLQMKERPPVMKGSCEYIE